MLNYILVGSVIVGSGALRDLQIRVTDRNVTRSNVHQKFMIIKQFVDFLFNIKFHSTDTVIVYDVDTEKGR